MKTCQSKRKKAAKLHFVFLQYEETLPDNVHLLVCSSRSRGDKIHQLECDESDGSIRCSCEQARFRLMSHGQNPNVNRSETMCAHMVLFKALLEIHGVSFDHLLALLACRFCGVTDAEYSLADDYGHPIPGRICADCVIRKTI